MTAASTTSLFDILSIMIQGKKGPYFLLLTLIIIACFVGGMQYGKSVERADTQIKSMLSITPPQTISPTGTDAISFKTYTDKDCGIEFIYPSTFMVQNEASFSAQLIDKNTQQSISINCSENPVPTPKAASSEAELGNSIGISYVNGNTIQYRVRNQKGDLIVAEVSKELAPLFTTSFSFIQ